MKHRENIKSLKEKKFLKNGYIKGVNIIKYLVTMTT